MSKTFFFLFFCCFCLIGAFGQNAVLSRSGNRVTVNAVAATSTLGLIQLSGDLAGTGTTPTITNDAVLKKTLTGLATNTASAISSTHTVLEAIGLLQGQLSALPLNGVAGSWSVPANSTREFKITLPLANTSYEFSANGSVTNGILVYLATIITTNANTPRFLIRKVFTRYSGNALNVSRDPIMVSSDAGFNTVFAAETNNGTFGGYAYNHQDIIFQITNNNLTETAVVKWKYTY